MGEVNAKIVVLEDNSGLIKKATKKQLRVALKACGAQAQGHAVDYATQKGVVDTGLLRNSITFALSGSAPAKKEYHSDRGKKKKSGKYEGNAPEEENAQTVFIGTNVEYAVYNELGHKTLKGKEVAARPFLRPALENHMEEYRDIIESTLEKLFNGK